MIKLEYFESARDNRPRALTLEKLLTMIRFPKTQYMVREFRRTGDDKFKRALPAISWQATFPAGVRANLGAEATGLFMLDVDHISKVHPLPSVRDAICTPRQMYEETIRGREDELDIVCVHGSPGGDGIHVVALCQPGKGSILENQQWLAAKLGTPFDQACHDPARLGFVSIAEDWYYLDTMSLFVIPQTPEIHG